MHFIYKLHLKVELCDDMFKKKCDITFIDDAVDVVLMKCERKAERNCNAPEAKKFTKILEKFASERTPRNANISSAVGCITVHETGKSY